MERRSFLKLAGVGLVGACTTPLACGVTTPGREEADPAERRARRWAMVIDTRKCLQKEGCRACSAACDRGHNVPAMPDPRHRLEWIWKEPFANVFPEQVTRYTTAARAEQPTVVLCNHCDNPACVRVCPTQATFRRADGIVMMDEHRCIGCRYCLVACPYGARSFNWEDPRPYVAPGGSAYPTRTKGVVEKCTFCAERLAVGERPLCLEACEQVGARAITFGDVSDPRSEIAELLRTSNVTRRKPELGTSPHVFYIV